MKIIFLGTTKFSFELLKHLCVNNLKPMMLFTMPEEFSISYSHEKIKNFNYCDLIPFCDEEKIPVYQVDSGINTRLTDYYQIISELEPDVILVMGWYYMVPKSIRMLAKYGAWGIHASLLPKYAGGAPLVWAIINGEKETGITLFRLDDGVDDGEIITQKTISIQENDTIKEVYDRVTLASKDVLIEVLSKKEKITFTPQDKSKIEIWPHRTPNEGEIDLSRSTKEIYNFIRAQSEPYPGAFIKTIDGFKLIIEKVRIELLD